MTDTQVAGQEVETTSTTPSKTLPIIAHRGGLELLDAKWELNSGRTVKFRLVSSDETPMILHPFAQFVRRRGHRVGTRFYVAITRVGDEQVFYQGELMLAGGGNPLGQGMWVRFWMDEEATSHPFSGCAGRRGNDPGDLFEAAFVELDDDDEPINQEKRARLERANGAPKGGAMCRWAAMRGHDGLFLQWLSEEMPLPDKKLRPVAWWAREDHVARWIRWLCGVESRADLDNNAKAGEIFHERIRRPYSEWRSTSED
jgi:hypothetical protein